MEGFAHSNEFCPNEACPDYGKLQNDQTKPNLKKIGKTRAGVQRYQCKTCNGTFTETRGTIFYRKRTPEHQILETLALLAEGNRISSLTRAKGFKEDTILEWLREAATHSEQVEAVLMHDFKVKRGQLDALWAYVGRKKRWSGG
jgi:transposase-like protein